MDAIDSALKPFKPQIQRILLNLPKPINDLSQSLIGPKCHATLIQAVDFSSANQECLSLAVSKALGSAIVATSAVVKLPQLAKLLESKSAAGVSFASYALESAAFMITFAYNLRQGFPFSTFGETAFILVQDCIIAVLVCAFSKNTGLGATFITAMVGASYFLLALPGQSGVVSDETLTWLQGFAGVLAIASKVPQIMTVYNQGGTGQLSGFAVFNYLLGSIARIFTTLKEVPDPLILYGFIAGGILNAVLAAQFIYYWNAPMTSKGNRPSGPRAPKSANAAGASSGADTASKGRTPVTRRRG